jgi:glycosyltransferase involved in cell wall biosynthesis
MSTTPVVSVIIIFLNAADFLQEAIESALAQTYQHWEILLVDDGSSDGSSEMARSFAARDPLRIICLEHDGHQNLGMSAARNLGVLNAKGEYFAFLDADDYWLPDRLETHVRILDSYPEVGMLYGTTKYWYSWRGRPEDRGRDFVPKLSVRQNTLFDPPALLPPLLDGKIEVPCTCSILVRRDVIQKIGGFEESFRGMYEDQAFYTKVGLSAKVLATNDCLARYRQHPNSHSSVAIQSGELFSTQLAFLKWLEEYCSDHGIQDETVLQMIRRKIWLNRNASPGYFPFPSPKTLHWMKKWVLWTEERVLPSQVRNRLWMRR